MAKRKAPVIPLTGAAHADQVSRMASTAWEVFSSRDHIATQMEAFNIMVGFTSNELNKFYAEIGKHMFVLGVLAAENPLAAAANFEQQLEEMKKSAGGVSVDEPEMKTKWET